MNFKFTSTFIAATTAMLLFFAPAAESADSVNIDNVKTLKATVESIDEAEDIVWIRDTDGRSLKVGVSRSIRKSENIQVGDRLIVKFKESIVASVKRKGSRANDDDDAGNTASTSKHHVVAGSTTSRTGIVQSVDKIEHTISYKDADGFSRDATVTNRDAQRFIDTLKPGDEVEVTYTDAFAISVEHDN
jgi:hypothetical protein